MNSHQQQVIKSKNSLLSCAVTGGFEEFTGSGIVLQAAAGELKIRVKLKASEIIIFLSYLLLFLMFLFCTHSIVIRKSSSKENINLIKRNIAVKKMHRSSKWKSLLHSLKQDRRCHSSARSH